jgi:hypothetical protein
MPEAGISTLRKTQTGKNNKSESLFYLSNKMAQIFASFINYKSGTK